MSSQRHDVKFRREADEIEKLARAVFDYEDWNVWQNGAGIHLCPTGSQMPAMHWPNVQECLDDLRFRRLTRFTSLEQHQ